MCHCGAVMWYNKTGGEVGSAMGSKSGGSWVGGERYECVSVRGTGHVVRDGGIGRTSLQTQLVLKQTPMNKITSEVDTGDIMITDIQCTGVVANSILKNHR